MRYGIIILICFLLISFGIFGQMRLVEGVVYDLENNEPLFGVTVYAKDEKDTKNIRGAVTDMSGYYQFEVNDDDVLCFNYIGYYQGEECVEGKDKINMPLVLDSEHLFVSYVGDYEPDRRYTITGYVYDEDKQPLRDVKVRLLGAKKTVYTNCFGFYRMLVPAKWAKYNPVIEYSLDGYKKLKKKDKSGCRYVCHTNPVYMKKK